MTAPGGYAALTQQQRAEKWRARAAEWRRFEGEATDPSVRRMCHGHATFSDSMAEAFGGKK